MNINFYCLYNIFSHACLRRAVIIVFVTYPVKKDRVEDYLATSCLNVVADDKFAQ